MRRFAFVCSLFIAAVAQADECRLVPAGVLVVKPAASMDVSYCEHDPGHSPYWEQWQTVPGNYEPNPCYLFNTACRNQVYATYDETMAQIDKDYRLCVCGCWEQYPDDTPSHNDQRALCILGCEETAVAAHNAALQAFQAAMRPCCLDPVYP